MAPEPVRTRSFCRSTTAGVAALHSRVPARLTWTLPSIEAKRAPSSTLVAGGGGGGAFGPKSEPPERAERATSAPPASARVR